MRSVEPEVFLVAKPDLDYDELARYLREIGGESWLERLERGDFDAQNLAEFAGRLCYRSFEPGLNPNVTRIRQDQTEYLRNSSPAPTGRSWSTSASASCCTT
jgi:thymidylate synthase (FAD)